ncbi:UvrD-helicase domain-containing protein, partial [bacterium]|nr:UvrD-helicase domain-containing protein [bacterium]
KMTNDLVNTGNTNIEKGSESSATQGSLRKKYVLKKRQPTVTEYKVDYEKELNPQQLQAVMSKEGSILVIAGAGSGKTKTLTFRVARLIEDGVAPENILLLTFTKKAAAEMLNRATSVLDDRCENVAGGTFHSFANMILRKYSKIL